MIQNINELKAKMLEEDPRQGVEEEQPTSPSDTYVTTYSTTRSGSMESHPVEEYVDDFHSMTFMILDQHGEPNPVRVSVERGMLQVMADGTLAAMMTGATNMANLVLFTRSRAPRG